MLSKKIKIATIVFVSIVVITLFLIAYIFIAPKYDKKPINIDVLQGDISSLADITIINKYADFCTISEDGYEYSTYSCYEVSQTMTFGNTAEVSIQSRKTADIDLVEKVLSHMTYWPIYPNVTENGAYVFSAKDVSVNLYVSDWILDSYWKYPEQPLFQDISTSQNTVYVIEDCITFADNNKLMYIRDRFEGDEFHNYFYDCICYEVPPQYDNITITLGGKSYILYKGVGAAGLNYKTHYLGSSDSKEQELEDYYKEEIQKSENLSDFELDYTCNSGIYELNEDGTTTYVLPIETSSESDLTLLDMIACKTSESLVVLCKKGTSYLAYIFTPATGNTKEIYLYEDDGNVIRDYTFDITDSNITFFWEKADRELAHITTLQATSSPKILYDYDIVGEECFYIYPESTHYYDTFRKIKHSSGSVFIKDDIAYICFCSDMYKSSYNEIEVYITVIDKGNIIFQGTTLIPCCDIGSIEELSDFSLNMNKTDFRRSLTDMEILPVN